MARVLPFSSVKLTPLTAWTVFGLPEQAAADMVVANDIAAFKHDLAHDAGSCIGRFIFHEICNRRQTVTCRVLRQGREQRTCVRAFGRLEQREHISLLHLAAFVLNDHAIGGFRDHAHIMGDHDQAHAVLGLQADEKIEDLLLDGHIQRRRRLISNQQLRIAGNGDGDHDALALAAGHLVRVGVETLFRRRNAHLLEAIR